MKTNEILLLVLIIALIVVFILISYFWDNAIETEYKASTLIPGKPPTLRDPNPDQLLLTSGQQDSKQPKSGYNGPTLRQPCIKDSDPKGLANLPNAYILEDCGPGAECSDSLYKGSICLSKIGFGCISKNDCVPGASDCINNICVSNENKLNSICLNDGDCQSVIGPNNLSCVKTVGGTKRCKINNYPFGYGCDSFLDCSDGNDFNNVECLANIEEKNPYDLSSKYNTSYGLSFTADINLFNSIKDYMNNKLVLIIDKNSSEIKENYYTITNFTGIEPYTFTPVLFKNNVYQDSINFVDNYNYTVRMIASTMPGENYCVSKIPEGGKINSIENTYIRDVMTNLNNPCDGDNVKVTKGEDSYCLSSLLNQGALGYLCDASKDSQLNCNKEAVLVVNDKTYQPGCLYDQEIENNLANNYNFNNNDNFKTMGRCLHPIGKSGDSCNKSSVGCSIPNICIEDNDSLICLKNFNQQECSFDDQCADGFICNQDKQCIPEQGNICLDDDCNNNVYLYKYTSGRDSKYTKIIQIPFAVNSKNFNLYMGQKYIDQQISKFVVYDKINKNIVVVVWDSSQNKYVISENRRFGINLQSGLTFHSIVIDPDDKILLFYKKKIRSYTRRSYYISDFDALDYVFIGTSYANLQVGTPIIYYNYNGATLTNFNKGTSYRVNEYIPGRNLIKIEDNNGAVISPTHYDKGNYFITYDNTVSFGNGTVSWNAGIGYCDGLFEGTSYKYSWVNTGDKFYNTGTTQVEGLTYGLSYTETLNETSPYFFSQITSYDRDYSYYMVSDSYNTADGSAPFINEKKFITQQFTYNNSTAKLYDDMVTYGVTEIDISTIAPGEGFNLELEDLYVNENTDDQLEINGLPVNGITYAFEEETKVKFSTYTKDNQNSLLIDSQIRTDAGSTSTEQLTKNINYVQKVNYTYSTYDDSYQHQFKPKNGLSWFNFSYVNNAVAPTGKNLFEEDLSISFIKYNDVINNYQNNFVVNENQDLNIFTTYGNNQNNIQKIQNNEVINIATESNLKKVETNYTLTENPPDKFSFKGKTDIFNIAPQPLDGNLVHISKATKNQNTFIEGENIITLNNQKDIDTVLKFASSEIAIVKELSTSSIKNTISDHIKTTVNGVDTDFYYDGTGGTLDDQVNWCLNNTAIGNAAGATIRTTGNPQIILVITDIIEHNVELSQEFLKCKINRPINYNTNSGTCAYQFESLIIDNSEDSWNFYTYNCVSMSHRNIYNTSFLAGQTGMTYMATNFFDGSILYTSTKNSKFFKENSSYNKTGFNKIITRKVNSDGIGPTKYTINTINDGYGIKYNDIIQNYGSMPAPVSMQDQNGYDNNYIFSGTSTVNYPDNGIQTGVDEALFRLNPTLNIENIGLPLNIPFMTENYPYGDSRESTPNPNFSGYPSLRNYSGDFSGPQPQPDLYTSNYYFILYPLGRVGLLLTLLFYEGLKGENSTGKLLNDFKHIFGQSLNTGYTADELSFLPSATDGLNYNSTGRRVIALNKLYNEILTNNISYNGRKIQIDDLIAGPHFSCVVSLTGSSSGWNNNITVINNLFMSSLNYASNLGTGHVLINNERIEQNYVISNVDDKNNYKKKSSLKLNVDSMPFVVEKKSNNKIISNLDNSNIDFIDWPSWISSLTVANRYAHKILNVIYDPRENNSGSNANYYVYTSYIDEEGDTKYQMYYFNVNKNLTSDAGVPLASPSDEIYNSDNIIMEPLSDSFYMLAESKL